MKRRDEYLCGGDCSRLARPSEREGGGGVEGGIASSCISSLLRSYSGAISPVGRRSSGQLFKITCWETAGNGNTRADRNPVAVNQEPQTNTAASFHSQFLLLSVSFLAGRGSKTSPVRGEKNPRVFPQPPPV